MGNGCGSGSGNGLDRVYAMIWGLLQRLLKGNGLDRVKASLRHCFNGYMKILRCSLNSVFGLFVSFFAYIFQIIQYFLILFLAM